MQTRRLNAAVLCALFLATGLWARKETPKPNACPAPSHLHGALGVPPRAPQSDDKPLTLISWNVKHLGRDNEDRDLTAGLLEKADLVAFQEVDAGKRGLNALNAIAKSLGKKVGDTICQGLTQMPSDATERYALLWRQSRVAFVTKTGELAQDCTKGAFTIPLVTTNADKIVREPALATFEFLPDHKRFKLAVVHLLPSGKSPQKEVPPLFEALDPEDGPLILGGDFNLDARHPIFYKPVHEMCFTPVFSHGEKTSLERDRREGKKRKRKKGDPKEFGLKSSYDNFYYRHMEVGSFEVINLATKFPNLSGRDIYKKLSDHCPVIAEFYFY